MDKYYVLNKFLPISEQNVDFDKTKTKFDSFSKICKIYSILNDN